MILMKIQSSSGLEMLSSLVRKSHWRILASGDNACTKSVLPTSVIELHLDQCWNEFSQVNQRPLHYLLSRRPSPVKIHPFRKNTEKMFFEPCWTRIPRIRAQTFLFFNVRYICRSADSLNTDSESSTRATICAVTSGSNWVHIWIPCGRKPIQRVIIYDPVT